MICGHAIRSILATTSSIAVALQPALAEALPSGGQVSAGQGSISTSANALTVTQSSQRAVINWTGFDTGAGETVRFVQPSASAIALNRIGGAATSFDGSLLANGNVWLLNPNGILFGQHAQVNVGGLLATTSRIADSDFMAGNYAFTPGGNPSAAITNNGALTVAQGGLAALVAPNVVNSGTITAKLGKVQLGSGDTFTVDLYGDGLINLAATPAMTAELVANHGSISADGGNVVLTTAQAQNVVNSLINMDGIIEADAVGERTGSVRLTGSDTTSMSGSISAKGGSVETSGETLSVSGTVTAKEWRLDPNNVTIQAAGSDTNVSGNPNFTTTDDSAVVTTGSIETALNNGTSVTVQTGSAGSNSQSGDIEVASSITKSAGADASLTLEAYRNITLDTGVQISSTSGKLNVTLDADHTGIGSGAIYLASGSGITSNGGNIVLGGGPNPITGSAYGNNAAGDTDFAGNTVYQNGIDLEGATLNAGGGNISLRGTSWNDPSASNLWGVLVQNTVLETSGTGTITVVGTAADGPGYNEGIYINDSTVQSTAGTIAITGIGVNATSSSGDGLDMEGGTIQTTSGEIQLTGIGSSAEGIYFSGDWSSHAPLIIQTQSGNISVNGTGGTGSDMEVGIWIDGGASITATGTGNITLNGIAGNGADGGSVRQSNPGVAMMNDGFAGGAEAVVRVHDGNLSITGTGNGAGVYNDGIFLDGGAVIDSTGAGSITLSGHGPNGAAGMAFNNDFGSVNSIGSGATHGNITLIADSLDSSALSGIQTTGNVTFAPYTAGTTIGVGSGTGALAINDALLALTSFGGTLTIGSGNSGDMDINSASAILNQGNVTFMSGGDIEVAGNLSKSGGSDASLAFDAFRNISIDTGVQIASTSGKLNVTLDADHTGIGSGSIYMAPGSGITSNGGDITLGGGSNPLTGSAYGNDAPGNDNNSSTIYGNGIYLNDAQLLAGGGNISLTGTSWADPLSQVAGILMLSGSLLQTDGMGSITLTGSGGNDASATSSKEGVEITSSSVATTAGTITITGTGGNGDNSINLWNTGVDIEGDWAGTAPATITSTSGNIFIRGTGGSPGSQVQSQGIVIYESALQTDSGAISLLGTSEDSSFTDCSGCGWNTGVDLEGNSNYTTTIQTNSGDIDITGTAGSGGGWQGAVFMSNLDMHTVSGNINITGNAAGGSYGLEGIESSGGMTIEATGTGNITIIGIGGNGADGTPGNGNAGVLFDGGCYVAVNQGQLTIVGTGNGAGTDNYGLWIDGGTVLDSTGTGSITLRGNGNNGAAGIAFTTDWWSANPTIIGSGSTHGDITLISDSINLNSTAVQTTGNVTFAPYTAGTTIGVGSGTGTLAITDAMLGTLTYGSLTIGGSSAGAVDIDTATAFTGPVTFISGTGSDITLDGALTSSSTGTAFTLASGRNFINDAGASAFDMTGGGPWLIYSTNPANDSADGLVTDFTRTSCSYGGSCPSFPGSGNGALYSYTPVAAVNAVVASPQVTLPSTVQNILSHNPPASGDSASASSGLIVVDRSLLETLGADQDAPWWDGVQP